MNTELDLGGASAPVEFTGGKTKGKRSKLSQRRPASQKEAVEGGGGLLIPNEGNNGSAEDAGVHPNASVDGHHYYPPHQTGALFHQGGSDHMGLHMLGMDASLVDGGLMQQGSPTLLSALKGSSLRASAYGQDFSAPFKDDDLSILGDFKNAAARFSLHPLGGADDEDELTRDGDLESDSLWGSFPVDVDSLLPGGGSVPYGELSGGVRYDMDGMSGDEQGQDRAEPSGADTNGSDAKGDKSQRGGNGGVNSELFQPLTHTASSQYIFPYGSTHGSNGSGSGSGSGGGGGSRSRSGSGSGGGAGQPSMSTGGGMYFDSSYNAYSHGMQQHQQDSGTGGTAGNMRGMQMGPNAHMRGVGGSGPGPEQMAHMQQMQMQMQMQMQAPNGGQTAFNGQQQLDMLSHGMPPVRYFVTGEQGQQVGYMQGPYQQQPVQGQLAHGSMTMQQPYQYSRMLQPGQQPHVQQQGRAVGKGVGAASGEHTLKGGKRQSGATKQKTEGKRKANKGNAHADLQQPVNMGGAGMPAPPCPMVGGQLMPVGSYGVQAMQAQQMGLSGSQRDVYQQQQQMGGSGSGGMMQSPGPGMSQMYSISSSVSTHGSGYAAGPTGGLVGGPMMMPSYIVNQMPMGTGVGGNGSNGHVQQAVGNDPEGMGDSGLAELESIVAKLDGPTANNIKESLYRLARSARTRGVRSGDGGVQGLRQPPPVSDKSQSLVDRCVANLLYHRYTDTPAQENGVHQHGQQQTNIRNNNTDAGGNNDDGVGANNDVDTIGVREEVLQQSSEKHAGKPWSAMMRSDSMANGIQGRHGSA